MLKEYKNIQKDRGALAGESQKNPKIQKRRTIKINKKNVVRKTNAKYMYKYTYTYMYNTEECW